MGNDLIQIGKDQPREGAALEVLSPAEGAAARAPAGEGKTFYIETFGCQMNVHDSEKVAGVLMARGYRPVDTHQDADIILYNTCSIREKAAQKVFSRLGTFRKAGSATAENYRRAGLRGAAGRRALFRARAAGQPGVRFGELSAVAGAAGATRVRKPPGDGTWTSTPRIVLRPSSPAATTASALI